MTARFILIGSRYVNTDHIMWVDASGKVGTPVSVHMSDGDVLRSEWLADDDLTTLTTELVPAAPGFTALTCGRDDDGEQWVARDTVVAWRIDSTSVVGAVALDSGSFELAAVVETPAGRVVDMNGGRDFDNAGAWLAAMREAAREPPCTAPAIKEEP